MQPSLDSKTLVSTPMTKYTAVKAQNLPVKAIQNLKRAIDRLFPDLAVSDAVLAGADSRRRSALRIRACVGTLTPSMIPSS